jgi:hypothetical protein
MKLSHLVLSLSLTLGAASAAAQNVPPAAANPSAARPAPVAAQAAGNLARYIVGPGGRVRGFALNNGTVVMLPPRAGGDFAQRVAVGVPLRVEGFSLPGAASPVIFRATVRGVDGTVLVAAPQGPMGGPGAGGHGPWMRRGMGGGHEGMRGGMHGGRRGGGHGGMHGDPGARAARFAAMPQQSVRGTVQQVINGPRGNVRTLLLSNNVTVFVPHEMTAQVTPRGVRVGETVQAVGRGTATPQGTGVLAEQITFGDGTRFTAVLNAPGAAPGAPPAAPPAAR